MTTSQIVVVMVSVIIGAVLKSTSGIGMPFVTIPAISYIATIEEAVVVGALPNLALNLALVWAQRSHWSQTRDLARLSAFAFVGGRSWHVPAGVTSREAADSGAHLGGARVRGAQAGLARIRGRPRNVTPVGASRWVSCRNHAGRRGHLWTDRGVVGAEPSARPKRADPGGHGAIRRSGASPNFPVLVASGELKGLWIVTLAACIPALATVPLGSRIRDRLSSAAFDQFVLALLVFSAIGLAWRTFG